MYDKFITFLSYLDHDRKYLNSKIVRLFYLEIVTEISFWYQIMIKCPAMVYLKLFSFMKDIIQ